MLNLKTRVDLQRLVDDGIQESLTLDYKASPSLSKDSKSRDELCKDVSALANSAGGQLVYGIEEKNQKPVRVDEGTAPEITREWLEQVIDSNIQPRINGLVITPVPLDKGNGYVITVPQTTTRGAHQAPDKKYYKRQNFQSVPMEDYEIRDVLRRSEKPDLFLNMALNSGQLTQAVEFSGGSDQSDTIPLHLSIGNHSDEPALYSLVKVMIDVELKVAGNSGFGTAGTMKDDTGNPMNVFTYNLVVPHSMPVFKGARFIVGTRPFELSVHSSWLQKPVVFPLWYEIICHGFSKLVKGQLRLQRSIFHLEIPDNGQ